MCKLGVDGKAYNYANNDCANYLGCANKRGSNYPGYTVHPSIVIKNTGWSVARLGQKGIKSNYQVIFVPRTDVCARWRFYWVYSVDMQPNCDGLRGVTN